MSDFGVDCPFKCHILEHACFKAGFPTCRDVDAAPMSRPKDWATRAVDVDKAMKSR